MYEPQEWVWNEVSAAHYTRKAPKPDPLWREHARLLAALASATWPPEIILIGLGRGIAVSALFRGLRNGYIRTPGQRVRYRHLYVFHWKSKGHEAILLRSHMCGRRTRVCNSTIRGFAAEGLRDEHGSIWPSGIEELVGIDMRAGLVVHTGEGTGPAAYHDIMRMTPMMGPTTRIVLCQANAGTGADARKRLEADGWHGCAINTIGTIVVLEKG